MLIKFDTVSKNYGKTPVLDKVSFTIETGEFVFLVGPSGVGKTTILRLLIRDLMPTSGNISIGDLDVTSLPNHKLSHLRRIVGTVFQDFKILFDRTVFENIAISLEILGFEQKEIT